MKARIGECCVGRSSWYFNMWLPILLALMTVGCSLGERHHVPYVQDKYISGGQKVSISNVPYQLALEYNGILYCGASIISEYWALTAGHCTIPEAPQLFRIRSGTDRVLTGGKLHKVIEMIRHETYNGKTPEFDIAVVRVDTPFNPAHILRLAKVRPAPETTATVTGYRDTEHGPGSTSLFWVHVPVIRQEDCKYLRRDVFKNYMMCSGQLGKTPCQSVAGGPLVVGKVQVGVAEGLQCSLIIPEIFYDVSVFREWIVQKAGL